ncbi:WRKY domain - like 10 [Theobroma cacao]|nr:WRKY domain - like 10 [Theobroma cacao]
MLLKPNHWIFVLQSPFSGELAAVFLNQQSNTGNNQQSTIGREENNSSDVSCLSIAPPKPLFYFINDISTFSKHNSNFPTVLLNNLLDLFKFRARLQARSFEEVAKQSQSKGNLQANYGNYYKQYSHLVKSRKSDDAYSWRCIGIKGLIGNRRRSFYKCARPGFPATKSVDRSLDGQITEIIHKARHNHPES